MRGVIDIGSNTIRLSIYKILEDDQIIHMFHNKTFVGLAAYVDELGMLSDKGISKAVDVLNDYREIIDIIELDTIYPFATASLRNVINTGEALKAIEMQTGFDIDIISGEEEGIYDYIGANHEHQFCDGLLIDIGGGSTEIVSFEDGQILDAVSIPAGALNMYTKFVEKSLPTKKDIKQIKKYVLKLLDKFPVKVQKNPTMCGVGGTIRATCKLNNDLYEKPRTNKELRIKTVNKMIDYFEGGSKSSILELVQVIPERTHTILPGMIILRTVAEYYNCKKIVVSEYGLREGYLISQLSEGKKIV